MRIPYFLSFYSSALLLLTGAIIDGGAQETSIWAIAFSGLALAAIVVGIIGVVATHRRRA